MRERRACFQPKAEEIRSFNFLKNIELHVFAFTTSFTTSWSDDPTRFANHGNLHDCILQGSTSLQRPLATRPNSCPPLGIAVLRPLSGPSESGTRTRLPGEISVSQTLLPKAFPANSGLWPLEQKCLLQQMDVTFVFSDLQTRRAIWLGQHGTAKPASSLESSSA